MSYLNAEEKDTEYLYRCEARRYSYTIDPEREIYGTTAPEISIDKYKIIKRTSKGAWIEVYTDKKFVLLTANKRFACETETEAIESIIARRKKAIRLCEKTISRCKEDIEAVKNYKIPG